MGRGYTEEQIQQVVEANDIVDVISQYVTLKKSGSQYMGRCPFHNEKTPSFSVSAEKQLYHCFGCGAGGNLITFVMNMENLNFIDAIKHLSQIANIYLPDPKAENDAESIKRERQYKLHREAALYFHKMLIKDIPAQRYLFSRGIQEETIKKFALGYSTSKFDGLFKHLSYRGYTRQEMLDSGLVLASKRDDGCYDRFRSRIMFPIVTVTGRVIGFGGRLTEKSEKYPKYLNSPENAIFTKGNHLYGLNIAKNNIKDGKIIAVEGYMDVISLHQAGVKNAVASLGTALTKGQGRLIKRYVDEVVLCYDGDEAGQRAMIRGIEVLDGLDLSIKVLRLPAGKDPDDFIKKEGLKAFSKAVDESTTTVEYKLDKLAENYDLNQTDQKIRFIKEATSVFKDINNEIDRQLHLKKFAEKMQVEPGAIVREMKNKAGTSNKSNDIEKPREVKKTKKNSGIKAQEMLLNLLFGDIKKAKIIFDNIDMTDFKPGLLKKTAEYAYEAVKNDKLPDAARYISSLEDERQVKYLTWLLMSELDKEDDDKETMYNCINTVKIFHIKDEISKLQEQMNNFSLNEEELNEIYCKIVDKKREIENIHYKGREDF
jgi:DNA primase